MHRRRWLALALVATLAAVYFAPEPGADEVALTQRAARARPAPRVGETRVSVASADQRVLGIRARNETNPRSTAGAFAPRQWTAPPRGVPAAIATVVDTAPAAPPPVAPPLPFRVLGRYTEGDVQAVFLQHQDQNLVVHVGDTVGDYRVESLKGSTLTLRYVPLNQTQLLDVGGGS